MFDRATITLGFGPHSSFIFFMLFLFSLVSFTTVVVAILNEIVTFRIFFQLLC